MYNQVQFSNITKTFGILLAHIFFKSVASAILLEIGLQLFCTLADVMALAIVFVAVFPNQPHIGNKLLNIGIAVVNNFLTHCSQIHRFSNDLEVIQNVEFDWVNGLLEPVGALKFETLGYYLIRYFLPEVTIAAVN